MLQPLLLLAPLAQADGALHFDGVDDHVTMGQAASLGLDQFTAECWFRWDGEGSDTAGTGSGGVSYYPLVAKGRGESDGSSVDMNYGLGIEASSGALAADFEDMADGSNHPIVGETDVRDGVWHHAAVTYDGSTWSLFLDGQLDATADTGGATPRYDSVQHLAVGTAMDSGGSADGRFRGAIDEVRLWSRARSLGELQGTMNQALNAGVDLVARWGFDEGTGSAAADSIAAVDGSVVGASWTAQAPFDASLPPHEPELWQPEDGATDVSIPATLEVGVEDPEGDHISARFYGRSVQPPPDDFSLVMLPDTQYYCSGGHDGEAEMFYAQTQWIVEQREALNIAWVAHVGDLVNDGDDDPDQWPVANQAMSALEDPKTTGLRDGIPYGIAPGNHDQSPNGDPFGTTDSFNNWFGSDRFASRDYYGGHYGHDNDDHWGTFTVGALDFLVLDLEYDQSGEDDGVLAWADGVISDHPDHRVIINAHHLIESSGELSDQGQLVYQALGHQENLFLMLSGHITGEVWRSDPAGAEGTVYSVMADYQFDGDGGAGWLRVFEFSPAAGSIHAWTYSPWLDSYATDSNSDFELPYSMDANAWELLDTVEVDGDPSARITWEGLEPNSAYEWYVELDDGRGATTGPVWSFTTGDGSQGPGDTAQTEDTDDAPGIRGADEGCGCSSQRGGGWAALTLGLLSLLRRRRRWISAP